MKPILNVDEAARYLQVSKPTLRIWLAEGRLKGVKIGREWRIREEDLEALLEPQEAA